MTLRISIWPKCSLLPARAIRPPVFPPPSIQLLEGIGWIQPTRSGTGAGCFHTHASSRQQKATKRSHKKPDLPPSHTAALDRLDVLLDDALQLLDLEIPPTEEQVLKSLETCEDLTKYFVKSAGTGNGVKASSRASSNLLFLDEGEPPQWQRNIAIAAAMHNAAAKKLSETARSIVKDPKVFMTAPVLQAYVHIQCLLGRPESFPEVFKWYAHKPVPLADSSPIKYMSAKPHKASSAVPLGIANAALDAAIDAKSIPLCLDIISATACSPAFHRSKFIRRALLPVTGCVLAPAAAYALATHLSALQETMSPGLARNLALAGILSYIGFTGTIGYVALTTANDQMDRVTWADGTRLRDRWLREEERSMIDKLVSSWGFKDPRRKGEEEGPEWNALKELVGLRGMVLDRVELMEGME